MCGKRDFLIDIFANNYSQPMDWCIIIAYLIMTKPSTCMEKLTKHLNFINKIKNLTIMEIRTKFAIGQSVVTNEGQKGKVYRISVELTSLGQVSLLYMVETGEDEYLENELYTESELTGEQGEYVINTKFSLGQKVYCVFGNDVDYGTIKEIICSYEQDKPEMMYTLGLNYPISFTDGNTDWGVFTEDEKDKLVDYIANNID